MCWDARPDVRTGAVGSSTTTFEDRGRATRFPALEDRDFQVLCLEAGLWDADVTIVFSETPFVLRMFRADRFS